MELAELFDTSKQNVSLHLKSIFEDSELEEGEVVKDSLTTALDGKRYNTKLYNLDAILAIGYRVRSPRGTQFRRWANTVLKEYLVKGFAIYKIKNGCGLEVALHTASVLPCNGSGQFTARRAAAIRSGTGEAEVMTIAASDR